eukprot:TRINITY_DN25427_c0_g1_i1.p1 TRINITY_DN25427_c0_g1~~TRINITY_DN25427_c0_g1_i1.p1  ORF type:complete len:114 (+),score=3.49 TRINITY_DN25427_c0_g1_i1:79-420(+)
MVSHGLGLWDDEEGSEGTFGGGGHHPKAPPHIVVPTSSTPPLPVSELPLVSSLMCHGTAGSVVVGAASPAPKNTTPLPPPPTTTPAVDVVELVQPTHIYVLSLIHISEPTRPY